MWKLVRDKIPQIIEESGRKCKWHNVLPDRRLTLLLKKLHEEVDELEKDNNLEECADVYEVILAIVEELGYTWEDLIDCAVDKRKEKGSFSQFIFLESVE